MNIVAVNLNPCIDWECIVPKYAHGGLNRVRRTRADVAGKGANVAVALKNLGLDPLCVGFNFAENGALLTDKLDAAGVRHDFVTEAGAIRVNMKLYEEESGVMTELNQPGAFVSHAAQVELLAKIARANGDGGILILSGSRPENVAADFYAKICANWRGEIFLDTEGEALSLALKAAPVFALKPNLYELESTFGSLTLVSMTRVSTREENENRNDTAKIADFCRKEIFSKKNFFSPKIICVSMGENGAVLVTPKTAFFCPALDVEAKGVPGAGDAMVAGMAYALAGGLPENEFLPAAMAAAAASVVLDGTQMCTRGGFEKMRGKIGKNMIYSPQ